MSRVVVLAPHPDDESLGCGGAIAKHVADGDEVAVVYLCDCGAQRTGEAIKACGVLGAHLHLLNEPDGRALFQPALRKMLSFLEAFPADIVYAPHGDDDHVDHKTAWCVAMALTHVTLRLYEVWTPLTQPDLTIDITPYVETKQAALACHVSQFKGSFKNGMDYGVLGLNLYRGAINGSSRFIYGECFQVVES